MKKLSLVLALAGLLGSAASAQAATETFTASTALAKTNWTDTLSFGKFDTNLGTLTAIRFDLSGLVSGSGMAESEDATPTNVTLDLSSTLTLSRPDASTLVVATPLFSTNFSLAAFDGTIDYSGASGASTGTVSNTASNSFTSSNASDFALFSAAGGGSINLGLTALGTSLGNGAGNLDTKFQTFSSGDIKVTYEYTAAAPVPEPATYAMMLGGLGLLAFTRRRAAKNKA